MKLAAVLLACAGCDVVFSIDHVADAPTCASPDEDGDRRNNVCDICPADADDARDADGDAVGDACDPDPMMPGDQIAMFDGFDDNLAGWTMMGGDWQLASGAFVQMTAGSDGQLRHLTSAKLPSAETIVTDLTPVGNGYAGVIASVPTGLGPFELKCYVIRRQSDGMEFVHLDVPLVVNQDMAMAAGTGPLRIMGGQMHDGRLYCRARHEGGVDTQIVTAAPVDPATIDQIGLITGSASATFTSLTLYDVP